MGSSRPKGFSTLFCAACHLRLDKVPMIVLDVEVRILNVVHPFNLVRPALSLLF